VAQKLAVILVEEPVSSLSENKVKSSLLKYEALAASTELYIMNFIHKEKLRSTIITLTLYGVRGKTWGN
jgi:hypothetical protein